MAAPVKKVPIHLQSSQNRLLIKNGKVVNDDEMIDADVYIEDGYIKEIGRNLIIPGGTRTIDASGKFVMPGGIDPHTHLGLEMMGAKTIDTFYSGTKAAIAGGTTTIIDFALPNKGESLIEAYDRRRAMADTKVCCDYALNVGVTWWSDSVKKEMETLCTDEYGVNSFKMFMAYRDAWMLDDYDLYSAFEKCNELKALPRVHAENGSIIAKNTEKLLAQGITQPRGHEMSRNEEVEAEAVNRACVIANQAGAPLYVVHMMSKDAVRSLIDARRRGQKLPVYGETLAATIGTDGSQCKHVCFRHAAGHVMSPPLRSDVSTKEIMIEALANDDLQLVGSDHCTFTEDDKNLGKDDFSKIPNGVNGIEERMSMTWEKGVHSGLMSPSRFVAVTSANAAKLFNLYPKKGRIASGSDADIVVWDPTVAKTVSAATHNQAVDFNIFEGQTLHGVPQYVIVKGRVCVDDGAVRVAEGYGNFVPCPTNSPYVFESEENHKHENNDDTPKPVTNGKAALKELTINVPPVVKYLEDLSVSSTCSTPTGRKMRSNEQRNMQDSTFSISEELEGADRRTSVRVRNPPGGKSSGLW